MRFIIAIFLISLFLAGMIFSNSLAQEKDIIFITNKHVTDSLSLEDIKLIYLGEKTKWVNGEDIICSILKDEKTYYHFLDKIIKMKSAKYNRYWKTQLFTGKGNIPKFLKTNEKMINFIFKNTGSIGFISPDKLPANNIIKIIQIRQ